MLCKASCYRLSQSKSLDGNLKDQPQECLLVSCLALRKPNNPKSCPKWSPHSSIPCSSFDMNNASASPSVRCRISLPSPHPDNPTTLPLRPPSYPPASHRIRHVFVLLVHGILILHEPDPPQTHYCSDCSPKNVLLCYVPYQ